MNKQQSIKNRIYRILEPDGNYDFASRLFAGLLLFVIIGNVFAVILESVSSIADTYRILFIDIEFFSAIAFSIEYVFRVWTCTENKKYRGSISGRLRFMVTPLLIVDLLAFAPFYIQFFYPLDQQAVTAWLVFRIFRVFKVTRYVDSLKIILEAIKVEKDAVFATLAGGTILLVVCSSLMFVVEHEAQPEAFSSIPASMWYGIATLTTLGYGDVIPVTTPGKILGGIMAILGVGMFVLPAGILAAGFEEQIHKRRKKPKPCPHCGKNIYAPPSRDEE